MLKVGGKAPGFTHLDQDGRTVSLKDDPDKRSLSKVEPGAGAADLPKRPD